VRLNAVAMSKAEKKAQRLEAREKRRAASGEIMASRLRTTIGFGGAYILTQVLPSFAPTLSQNQALIDTGLAVVGGAGALLDDGELGDYALGAALVGATQTFDNIGARINEWLAT
jgi:hypothetical protein